MKSQEYAGFWIRVGASLIDSILLIIITVIPLSLIYGMEYWDGTQMFYGLWDALINYVIPIVLVIWFWIRFYATPGKMFLNLKVLDAKTGKGLTVMQAIGRYFAYIISAIPLLLGFLWIGFDKKKQGWHDKLAGTVVIRYNKKQVASVEFEKTG